LAKAELNEPPQSKALAILSGPDGALGAGNSYDKYYATSLQKITFYVSLLEISLINDQCNEQAISNGSIALCSALITREQVH